MSVTFTVEDGTIVDGANSYVEVSFADDYLSIKSDSATWEALSTLNKQKYLMWATRLLDQRAKFPNTVLTDTDQPLRWPRQGAYDRDGDPLPDDIIPDQIKEASVEIAFNLFITGIDPSENAQTGSGSITKLKVAVIEINYNGAIPLNANAFPRGINYILFPLGSVPGGGGMRAVPIRKA